MKVDKYINKIVCDDNIKFLSKLEKECVDIIITSPPYDDLRDYENSLEWNFGIFKKLSKKLFRVLKEGGVMIWIVGDKTINGRKSLTSFKQAIEFERIGFNIYDVIIYEKTGTGPPHNNRYFNCFEYMFILSKGKPKTINLLKDKLNKWAGAETYSAISRREKDGSLTKKERKVINEYGVRTNIWKYANGMGFSTRDKIAYEHPAIFPEKLVEDHLLSWSKEGDLVLDPFGGSGTTAKISKKLNRNYISIDKIEKYCEIAKKRIESLNE